MKYLRKIGILIIAIVMAAAIAVGICVIYAVRNVNVTLLSYPDDDENLNSEILAVKEDVLKRVRGRVISSVSEADISSCLTDDYFLESFEKIYPCTINITVQQRREVFAVYDAGNENYSVYDENGKFLRTADNNLNSYDGAPNLILEGIEYNEDIKELASVCAIFKSCTEEASSLRSAVEKVTLKKSHTSLCGAGDKIVFDLWCGISIEIHDYQKLTEEKISKAYKYFRSLSTDQKLKGVIYSFVRDGEINIEYRANV